MTGELEGKTALITGGASGIGAATAELFAQSGARVVIADLQEEQGNALSETLGANVIFQRTDVSSADSIEAAVDLAVNTFGGLDIVFNNAGVSGAEGASEFTDNDLSNFDRVMAVDLLGPMLGSRAAARVMKLNGGGVILNTASIAATYPGYGLPEYRAAKAGVITLTKSLAIELGEFDIRVNSISPGPILTDIIGMGAEMTPETKNAVLETAMSSMMDMQVYKRVGKPADIAQAALFLASDRAAQITGVDLKVDGGASLGDRVNRQRDMGEKIAKLLSGGGAD
ncbi:MAG: SDR family oxidoreductase [Pseudomonadota bacterium]